MAEVISEEFAVLVVVVGLAAGVHWNFISIKWTFFFYSRLSGMFSFWTGPDLIWSWWRLTHRSWSFTRKETGPMRFLCNPGSQFSTVPLFLTNTESPTLKERVLALESCLSFCFSCLCYTLSAVFNLMKSKRVLGLRPNNISAGVSPDHSFSSNLSL